MTTLRAAAAAGLFVIVSALSLAGEADPAGDLLKPLSGGAGARGPVVRKLLEAVGGKDEAAKLTAGEALGRIGPLDTDLAPHFASMLSDGRPEVRAAALRALYAAPSGEQSVLQAIANRMNDQDLEVRVQAVRCLTAAGPSAKNSLQVLVGMLGDREPRVRAAAAEALGNLRSEARPALQSIANLFADKEPAVRRAAMRAFGRIGDKAAINVMTGFAQLAKEEDDLDATYSAFLDMGDQAAAAAGALQGIVYNRREKWAAVDLKGLAALARMTGRADPYARDLAAFLKDGEKKKLAAELLIRTPVAAAGVTDSVTAGLKDAAIAPMCVRILGRVGAVSRAGGAAPGKSFVPTLVALLDSDDDLVSAAALRALGDIGDLAAAPEVVKRAEKFGDRSQIWLQYALTRLKQEPGKAMGQLRVMGADPWKFRRMAQDVLVYLEAGGRGSAADED